MLLRMSDTPTDKPSATPPGWAADELTKFLQETHRQQYGSFHNKKERSAA
jgi:hypothetical protein